MNTHVHLVTSMSTVTKLPFAQRNSWKFRYKCDNVPVALYHKNTIQYSSRTFINVIRDFVLYVEYYPCKCKLIVTRVCASIAKHKHSYFCARI